MKCGRPSRLVRLGTWRFARPRPRRLLRGVLEALALVALLLAAALLDLLLERAQRLVRGAPSGAHQRGRALNPRVQEFAREALLQLDVDSRVGELEELLDGAEIGPHDALDQAGNALLQVLQPALGGVGQGHERAQVFAVALRGLGHFVADLLEATGRLLDDLTLAVGERLGAALHGFPGIPCAASRLNSKSDPRNTHRPNDLSAAMGRSRR